MTIPTDVNDGKKSQDVAVTDVLETIFETGQMESACIFWVENTGTKDLSTANVEVSPDNITWFSKDTTTLKVAAAAKAFLALTPFPYIRIQASCASGESTTLDIGITLT